MDHSQLCGDSGYESVCFMCVFFLVLMDTTCSCMLLFPYFLSIVNPLQSTICICNYKIFGLLAFSFVVYRPPRLPDLGPQPFRLLYPPPKSNRSSRGRGHRVRAHLQHDHHECTRGVRGKEPGSVCYPGSGISRSPRVSFENIATNLSIF